MIRVSAIETMGIPTMRLPAENALSALQTTGELAAASFFMIGYGVDSPLAGRRFDRSDTRRKVGTAPFMTMLPRALGLLANADVDATGGTCYGDSGGPAVLDVNGYRDVVMGVATTSDFACRATAWYYRLDTDAAREFLASHISLP